MYAYWSSQNDWFNASVIYLKSWTNNMDKYEIKQGDIS